MIVEVVLNDPMAARVAQGLSVFVFRNDLFAAGVFARERYVNPILWSAIFSGSLYAWAQRDSGEGQTGASWAVSRNAADRA